MNCLVVAAHPDDEVLGCGATISRMAREGHDVFISILGQGISSRYENHDQASSRELEELQRRCRSAAKLLGTKDIFTFRFPDNSFDTVPMLQIVKTIEGLVKRTKPEVIYTHYAGDLNIDHAITFRAVLTATRPLKNNQVKKLYSFEIPSSTEWAFGNFTPFSPNVFVDVSTTFELKIRALLYYESEAREYPHPRSPEALHSIAKRWGSTGGLEVAEAFQLIRSIC